MRKILVFTILVIFAFVAKAQDIHFSQFHAQPLVLNPAMSGLSGCDYRAGVNYRQQWSSVAAGNTYRTISAWGDMALGKPTKNSNFAGVGLSFFADQTGDLNYNTNRVDLSAAYHIMLSNSGRSSLSFGVQGGFIHRSIDASKGLFEFDPITGEHIESSIENFDTDPFMYGDASFGMLYSTSPKRESNYFFGFALQHLNQPSISRFTDGDAKDKLYMRMTLHAGAQIPLSKQLFLMPNLLLLRQGPHLEANIGAYLKFKLGNLPTDKNAIHFGMMYRVKDAMILATRADLGNFSLYFSYDLNASKLSDASKFNGGPELSLIYTGCIKRKNNSARYCPSY